MKKISRLAGRILSASLAALALVPAANAASVTVKHAQGETVVPVDPDRVLVFDLGMLDNLDRLGVKVIGVPQTSVYPKNLKKYEGDDFIKIGSLHEPDYEAVNAARPDLIIVAVRSASKYDALSKIAPTIDLTAWGHDLIAQVEARVETLGTIFGKEAQAKAEIEKLDAAIAALKVKAKGKGNGLVIMTSGGRISAFGPGSRFDVVHDNFGIAPATPAISPATHGQPVSSEFVLKSNPDWLFVIDRDAAIGQEGASARQVLDNDLVRQTTAWRKNQIVYLDSTDWYLLAADSLSALHRAIDQLSEAFDKAE